MITRKELILITFLLITLVRKEELAVASVKKVILIKVILMKRKIANQENVQSQTFGNVERTCSLMIQ